MTSNNFKDVADELQLQLRPLMSEHGFRTRGRSFSRQTPDGLTQLVHLQMGSFDPPGTTYVPGLRENLYGRLTVNLGVYVPEVAEYHGGGRAKKSIQEYHCSIRSRLGELSEERDVWWELSGDPKIRADISQRLLNSGLPWLDSLASRDAILAAMRDQARAAWAGSGPPRIVSAIILRERGNTNEARKLLRDQVASTDHPGHADYVRELAVKLGLGALDA